MNEKELDYEQWQKLVRRLFAEIDQLPAPTRIEASVHLLERSHDPFIRLNAKICLYNALGEYLAPIENEPPKRVRWLAEIEAIRLLPPSLWERLFRLWGLENLLRDALATGDLFAAELLTAMLLKDAKSRLRRFFTLEGIGGNPDTGDVLEALCEANGTFTARVRRAAVRRLRPTDPKKERVESQLDLPEDAPSPLEIAPSSEPEPAEAVADRDAVARLLARFGKRTADLLRLMMDGKSAAEAARILGISESTARVLLHKARRQFSRNP